MPTKTEPTKTEPTKTETPNAKALPNTNPDTAAGAAQFLSPIVVDMAALMINGKQAHWHVRGENFMPVHELLDTVVIHAKAAADVAAERIIALGLPVDARLKTVAAKTTSPGLTPGFQRSADTIREIVAEIDAALGTLDTAIAELGDIDPGSQDIAIAIEQQLRKDRWFLYAHISE